MPYAKATLSGRVIAESEDCVIVDGNYYFPPGAVDQKVLSESSLHTHCPYKGEASYYNLTSDKTENKDAAWYYPEAKDEKIRGFVAFYKTIVDVTGNRG